MSPSNPTPPAPTPVRVLSADEGRPAGALTARALQEDPGYSYVLPCPRRRARVLPGLLAGLARYTMRHGLALTAADGRGVALVLPPGGEHVRTLAALRCGLLRPALRLGPAPLVRLLRLSAVMDAEHARHVRGPHCYLLLLGVDPAWQGRGLGGALLREAARRTSGRPCYLETSLHSNVRFYERQGFAVLAEGRLPNGQPFWPMLRPG